MFAVIRYALFAVMLLTSFFSQADTGGYKVYTDYAGNIYLEAPKKFVLIHGEVSVPLMITQQYGYLKLTKYGAGWHVDVLTLSQWQQLQLISGSSDISGISYGDFDGDSKMDLSIYFANGQPAITISSVSLAPTAITLTVSVRYVYDALGRLKETLSDVDADTTYSYDDAGNRKQVSNDGQ